MGVVGTVVVEADALVWNSDCRVAPARTLVLFPPRPYVKEGGSYVNTKIP